MGRGKPAARAVFFGREAEAGDGGFLGGIKSNPIGACGVVYNFKKQREGKRTPSVAWRILGYGSSHVTPHKAQKQTQNIEIENAIENPLSKR